MVQEKLIIERTEETINFCEERMNALQEELDFLSPNSPQRVELELSLKEMYAMWEETINFLG